MCRKENNWKERRAGVSVNSKKRGCFRFCKQIDVAGDWLCRALETVDKIYGHVQEVPGFVDSGAVCSGCEVKSPSSRAMLNMKVILLTVSIDIRPRTGCVGPSRDLQLSAVCCSLGQEDQMALRDLLGGSLALGTLQVQIGAKRSFLDLTLPGLKPALL